jgi:hypothetical protein
VRRMTVCCVCWIWLLVPAGVASAQPARQPVETLLPDTVTGFLSIADLEVLDERFDSTQIGKLAADPKMDPFAKDIRRQLESRLSRIHQRLGLKLKDLSGVPAGEAAVALLLRTPEEVAAVLLIDVTGNVPKAQTLLDKVAEKQIKQGAEQSKVKLEGLQQPVICFSLPRKKEDPRILPRKACYLLTDTWLVASDDIEVIEDVAARFAGERPGSLAGATAFKAVMDRCAKDASGATPQIRWFIDPLGYVASMRVMTPPEKRRKGKSLLEGLRNQGFDTVEGVGGYVDFAVEGVEVIHRTSIYAPPPYQNAMKMAVFPNGPEFAPQRWVPRDIATYMTFYYDILNAFDNFGPLFDEMFAQAQFLFAVPVAAAADLDLGKVPAAIVTGLKDLEITLSPKAKLVTRERGQHWEITDSRKVYDEYREKEVHRKSIFIVRKQEEVVNVYEVYTGLWDEILQSLEEDPNGPQINLREELIRHLGQRITVVTDYRLPITPTSERLLFAIEVKNAKKVAAAIEKTMKDDPTVKRREIKGQIIWEIVEEEPEEVPSIEINLPSLTPGGGPGKKGDDDEEEEDDVDLLPHAAVTVAYDHLLVASHIDFLLKILEPREPRETLGQSIAYRLVDAKIQGLGLDKQCARVFSRTDERVRPTYELIRQGKMPEAETVLARLLNVLFGTGEEGVLREQKIEGDKLPDFEVVRRSLGPSGTVGVNEPNGWFIKGMILTKGGK